MNEKIEIPVFSLLAGDEHDKDGNIWTGSVGADSIHNNAFLFRINFYRKEDGDIFVCECYDCIMQMQGDESVYIKKEFEGSEQGREDMLKWIESVYADFLKNGKDKEEIFF